MDEPAKLKDADKEPTNPGTTWSNLMMGLRLGPNPHAIITGTPTPCKLIKYLVAHPNCITNRMSTFDNEDNLPQQTIEEMRRLPRTSRTARQELFAEILLDNPDSIFSAELIEQDRADPETFDYMLTEKEFERPSLRLVLGYDPSMSASDESDEAGIVLSGFTKTKEDGTHAFILEDHSGHLGPREQVITVVNLIIDKEIPELIVEQNQGAGFVLNNLKTEFIAHPDVQQVDTREIKKRRNTKAGSIKTYKYTVTFRDKNRSPFSFFLHAIHAKVAKVVRAELAAINYEQHRVHHPPQGLPICNITTCGASLEDQMAVWGPTDKDSPDRMDAAVYTLLHIFGSDIALSSKKHATIQTAAHVEPLPSYDPRQDLSRPPLTLTRHSRAYNIDIGGKSNEIGSDHRSSFLGPR
jgi:phage terminase large subunit-like protein